MAFSRLRSLYQAKAISLLSGQTAAEIIVMTIPNLYLTQEQILAPLRELYRRDLNHRKAIAHKQ